MALLNRWGRRLRGLLHRQEVEREMDEEMRFHLQMEIEDRIRDGMSPEEARCSALRDFGGLDRFKEEAREVRRLGGLDALRQDLRFGVRVLRKNPAFTTVAVLTLALGIGAITAVFSVVNGTLLRPLPYPEPDRIVTLWELGEERNEMAVTGGNFLDWTDLNRSFEAMAVHWNPQFVPMLTILGANTAVRTRVSGVSQGFFRTMGVTAAQGRTFAPEESQEGGPRVAVVSHSFWRNHLGEDPRVLGRVLDFSNAKHEIIGVMPPGFDYPAETDIWVPAEHDGIILGRRAHNYAAVGRLREATSVEEAQRDLSRITATLKEQYGGDMDAEAVRVTRLQDELVGDLRRPLFLLLGASGLVLLMACTNLASTFLARGAGREREIAVRASLGASRLRLIRQLFTESLVLAVLGAALGLGVAVLALRTLLALGPASLSVRGIGLDGWVLGFALLVAVATAILFGLVPALRTSESNLGEALRSGTRGNAGRQGGKLWAVLVGTEVSLAILLLIGSGLLFRSFQQVLGMDTGFVPEQVLTVDVSLPESRYSEDPQVAGYYSRLLAELEQIPGVASAGLIQHLPLGGMSHNGAFEIEGRGLSGDVYPGYRVASSDYFPVMGIPLRRGRLFGPEDHAGVGDVAVINQVLAERIWPGEDPIGRRVRNLANDSWIYPDRWITIVGVVGNVRHGGLLEQADPEIYVHYLQRPDRAQNAVVTLRTSVPPASVVGAARSRIRALDPNVPTEFATMSARVVESVADRRFTVLVLSVFAGVALVLAAVGIYGVVSYSVACRTREIGIRLALGARPAAVRALVQKGAMTVVFVGTVIGVIAALLLTRVIGSLLYGVSPTDPLTFGTVTLVLAAVAWFASYIPARRTTRIDPLITMRTE